MSLGDFLTDGFAPIHHQPVRHLPHWQPIGDCGTWECVGCGHAYRSCTCDPTLGRPAKWWEFDGYDSEDGAW